MINNAGILNRRISIYGMVTEEIDGFDDTREKLICNTWARIEPARGRQYYELRESATEEQVKITIRYRDNIKSDMKIRYKSHEYLIQSVVDPFADHESLELYCIERLRG